MSSADSIVIPSIQHTGTKFVASMFDGYCWKSLNEDWHERSVFVGHISPGQINNVKTKMLQHRAIVPLRHPFLVAESWKRRGKSIAELVDNFRLLVNEVDPLNPFYIAIDGEDREEHLSYINSQLDLNLKTDWSVVNSVSGTYNLNYKDLEADPIIVDLVDEIEVF